MYFKYRQSTKWPQGDIHFTETTLLRHTWVSTQGLAEKNNKLNLLTKTFDWKFLLCRKRLREFYDGILKIGAGILKKETITIRPNDKPWFYSLLRKFIRIQNGLHNKALGSKFLEKFYVLLLFKEGDPSVKSNYKPVSLSSCVSKIMETFHQ